MKVFLTGGTGLIGRALTRALLERGDEVVCVTRDRRRALSRLPRPIAVVEADPTAPGAWQQAAGECDAVVNLAGEPLSSGRWTARRKAAFRRSRLETTRNLVTVVDASERVRTLINGSAVGYYGGAGRAPLYEELGAGNDYLSRLAHEWEGAALDADITRTRVVALRIGVVFDRDEGALPRMVKPFMLGVGGPLGDPKSYVPWIHRHDLVRAILFLLDDGAVSGPVNAVAPDPPTQKELAEALGRVLDKPVRPAVPAFVLRLLLGEMADLVLTSYRAVPKVLRANGFNFEFRDLDTGLRDLLGQGRP